MSTELFRNYIDIIKEAEQPKVQLDEGVIIDKLKGLYQNFVSKVSKLPDFKKYYQLAKTKGKETVDAIKTSQSADELKQKIAQIGDTIPVNEAYVDKKSVALPAIGAAASAATSLFSIWAADVIGVYQSVAQYIAQGDTGMGIAGGLLFGVLAQVGYMGLALYLMSKSQDNARDNRIQDIQQGQREYQARLQRQQR